MIMQMSNAEGINLFLVTSVVNAKKKSVYTPDERLEQLIELTLRTIKAKVPSCYIVVMEGSKLTSEQSARIRQAGADELYHLDVNGRKKSSASLRSSRATSSQRFSIGCGRAGTSKRSASCPGGITSPTNSISERSTKTCAS